MKPLETKFAPAERADAAQIEHDAEMLARTGLVDHVTHVIPSILLILNKERQVVYNNRRLLELLDISDSHNVLGLRPGELLDCIHAYERGCSGCGTTEFCAECGAVKAILKSQREKVGVEAECRITTNSGGAYELKVWTSPYNYKNAEFTVFSIVDIRHEKRRQVLEQTFFHDLANMLTSISGHSTLLELGENEDDTRDSIRAIRTAARQLTAEVASHQKLLLAEKGELVVNISHCINSVNLITDLIQLASRNGITRCIQLAEDSDEFEIDTDRTLLFRILFNMLKNALEASTPEEVVTVRCKQKKNTGVFSVHNPRFIPRPVQLQIFQRSFTTKGSGHGLGTYSMRLFGEKYLNGKVGFITSKESGTTFHITLPLTFGDPK